MPTQYELDRQQERTKSKSGTIGTVRTGGTQEDKDFDNLVIVNQGRERRAAEAMGRSNRPTKKPASDPFYTFEKVDPRPKSEQSLADVFESKNPEELPFDPVYDPKLVGGGGGGGLPDGYVETDVILCVNGSPVYGQFLFKETI